MPGHAAAGDREEHERQVEHPVVLDHDAADLQVGFGVDPFPLKQVDRLAWRNAKLRDNRAFHSDEYLTWRRYYYHSTVLAVSPHIC